MNGAQNAYADLNAATRTPHADCELGRKKILSALNMGSPIQRHALLACQPMGDAKLLE